ncbi:MAG: hypothetical protein AVDCRST_MAG45-2284, partial [uncultured Solirubrobacterales bacterium]
DRRRGPRAWPWGRAGTGRRARRRRVGRAPARV